MSVNGFGSVDRNVNRAESCSIKRKDSGSVCSQEKRQRTAVESEVAITTLQVMEAASSSSSSSLAGLVEHLQGEILNEEGDRVNGCVNGFAQEYDYRTGRLKYEGQWKEDLRHGQGRKYCYDPDTNRNVLIYDGAWEEGFYHGDGKYYYPSFGHLAYKGQFQEGIYHGFGKKYDFNTGRLTYEGQFQEGVYHGEGKLYDPETGSLLYAGVFFRGMQVASPE